MTDTRSNDTKREQEIRKMYGSLYPFPSPTEHKRTVEHAKALRINRAMDDGLSAQYFTKQAASEDGYISATDVQRRWWMLCQQEEFAEVTTYEAGTVFIRKKNGPFHAALKVYRGRRGTTAPRIKLGFSKPNQSAYQILPYWEVGPVLFECEDVTFWGGAHGIYVSHRFREDQPGKALRIAIERVQNLDS